MFSRIPLVFFTTILAVFAVSSPFVKQHLSPDAAFCFRILFTEWIILTIARVVVERRARRLKKKRP